MADCLQETRTVPGRVVEAARTGSALIALALTGVVIRYIRVNLIPLEADDVTDMISGNSLISTTYLKYFSQAFASVFLFRVSAEHLGSLYSRFWGRGARDRRDEDMRRTNAVLCTLLLTAVAQAVSRSFYDISYDFPLWQLVIPIVATIHDLSNDLYIESALQGLVCTPQLDMGRPVWPTDKNWRGHVDVSASATPLQRGLTTVSPFL